MGYIGSARKHGINAFTAIREALNETQGIIFEQRVLNSYENNYKTVTLKELSSFFGYSERQMIRILKVCTGENFSSLIRSVKLSKACELLKHPDIRLADIINEVGYSNASHFYDSFRKKYGITPSEYRQQNQPDLSCIPYLPRQSS